MLALCVSSESALSCSQTVDYFRYSAIFVMIRYYDFVFFVS